MDLKRATRNRWIFGVCGGLAHRYGWNSLAVRLAVVLLAIFIPGPNVLVVAAYLVLAALLPQSREF